jgi:hypothetical protein
MVAWIVTLAIPVSGMAAMAWTMWHYRRRGETWEAGKDSGEGRDGGCGGGCGGCGG